MQSAGDDSLIAAQDVAAFMFPEEASPRKLMTMLNRSVGGLGICSEELLQDNSVRRDQAVMIVMCSSKVQEALGGENGRLGAYRAATRFVFKVDPEVYDSQLHHMAKVEWQFPTAYNRAVFARFKERQAAVPAMRALTEDRHGGERPSRGSKRTLHGLEPGTGDAGAPTDDDFDIVTGLIGRQTRCRHGRTDLGPADLDDPVSARQMAFATGLALAGQVMLVADPTAYDAEKGIARWRCPGSGCDHEPNSPGRLWRHIQANPSHIRQHVTIAIFSACLKARATGRRMVYVSDMVGTIDKENLSYIAEHTVHARIEGVLQESHAPLPKRARASDARPEDSVADRAPPTSAPAPPHDIYEIFSRIRHMGEVLVSSCESLRDVSGHMDGVLVRSCEALKEISGSMDMAAGSMTLLGESLKQAVEGVIQSCPKPQ